MLTVKVEWRLDKLALLCEYRNLRWPFGGLFMGESPTLWTKARRSYCQDACFGQMLFFSSIFFLSIWRKRDTVCHLVYNDDFVPFIIGCRFT